MTAVPPRIALLPPAVADAIAAGEVVERPASVVKELCENAVDAGATRLDVDIEGGGLVRIRVADDGCGIAAEDLPLAVARHATSKIRDVDDLRRITTLGFRGEALASIAAVAELVVVSRPASTPVGARIRVRAAEVVERASVATAVGTTVEVRDLFATTPARLRFLRSARTEAAAAARVAADLALCRPEIAVRCRVDGRPTLVHPGGDLRTAATAVYGSAPAAALREIAASDGPVRVQGLISEPHVHRATRDGLVLVVNGRRVHNRTLLVAIEEAYRGLLATGRHPFGVVVVDIDPEAVDVNVHPTKREVRFRDERAAFAAVQRACWATIQAGRAVTLAPRWEPIAEGLTVADTDPAGPGPASRRSAPPWAIARQPPLPRLGTARVVLVQEAEPGSEAQWEEIAPGTSATSAASPGRLADLAPLQAIGQVGTRWLVAASPQGVVLVDPHAAHEKVLYTRFLAAWSGEEGTPVASQLLLGPVVVECGPEAVAVLEERGALVAAAGFDLEPFGPAVVRCRAVPAGAAESDVDRLVRDLLATLGDDAGDAGDARHRLAALVACHTAVRFGDRLDLPEQQALLDALVATPGGITCPHGRPAVALLDEESLRRVFRRPAD